MTDLDQGSSTDQTGKSAWEQFLVSGLGTSLRTQAATWFVGAVIALLSVFSSHLTEGVKASINRADLRTKSYEELSKDLSDYVFVSELSQEYIEHGWTSRDAMGPLIKEYNDAITKLRKNEFVYLSWLSRYWGKAEVKALSEVMATTRQFDQQVHALNDEFEAVNIKKSKKTIDKERGKEASLAMRPTLDALRSQVRALLERSI
jgi:hypothetical protein